ncbi:MAG: hypothetical protein PHV82_09305 [Victivallaceae bacterium]|nr:hypothetical protein [Victivallaceae bacterium]
MNDIYVMGERRELFVDNFLIEKFTNAEQRLHTPIRRDVVLNFDAPAEFSNASGYQHIVKTDSGWRLYYHGGIWRPSPAFPEKRTRAGLFAAESSDGIIWKRCVITDAPKQAPHTVVTAGEAVRRKLFIASAYVFLDENPDIPVSEKFKMIVPGEYGKYWRPVLYLFTSPDGLHFDLKQRQRLDLEGDFDSLNLCFFDTLAGYYRLFIRVRNFGVRGIKTAVTKDFKRFHSQSDLVFNDNLEMALYTNGIQPYFRSPHLLLGFPKRYNDNEQIWDERMLCKPDLKRRVFMAENGGCVRLGTVSDDSILIVSRDGWHFKRYAEAFLRPGPCIEGAWVYGDCALTCGMVPTRSELGCGAPDELSMYLTENCAGNEPNRLRRCVLRTDGFVSLHFPGEGGEAITRPFTFSGGSLSLNLSTSAYGKLAIEILDENNVLIPSFELKNAIELSCDSLEALALWKDMKSDLRSLAGRPIKLRFVGRDADLYSMAFIPHQKSPKLPELTTDKQQPLFEFEI